MSTSSDSSKEEHLSLQYGMSADDGTYNSEYDGTAEDLEEIDVAKGQLEVYEDEGSSSSDEDDMEYGEYDIRKEKPRIPFDWTVLKKKQNLINMAYGLAGFIALVLIIHFPVAAKKKRNAANSNAVGQETLAPTSSGTTSGTFSGTTSGTWYGSQVFTSTGTGTYVPSAQWWHADSMGNETEAATQDPSLPWWVPPGQQPWWADGTYTPSWTGTHTYYPSSWTSTAAPEPEEPEEPEEPAELIEAEKEAQAAEEAAKEAEQAAIEAEQHLMDEKEALIPGFQRPTEPPTEAPVPVPTTSPTAVPTAAPVAWYVGWDGTWAPTNLSGSLTLGPTTWLPTNGATETEAQATEDTSATTEDTSATAEDVSATTENVSVITYDEEDDLDDEEGEAEFENSVHEARTSFYNHYRRW